MPTTLPEPFTVNGRYEITERPLGEGSMGVIYKAYDVVTKRFVALKTLWADATPATIELFEREWTMLARLSHPNIVDILDTGDWVFNGERRPYFVMPLLPGRTLEEIISRSSERLSVERTVDIISQACRGLQAAHDQNLVHRDIKPSNIFVMEDDTVKIIDFGVVHLTDDHSVAAGLKGTPLYMSPEQLEMKPATPLSDIFSLATVCYETLTGRKPFERSSATDIAEAIRAYIPPPASEINPAVNQLVSRTVHKAMAKQPWHRFSNAREFGDTLQKALRNDPIDRFERSKILPRIERVKKAYTEGDYQFALEVLRELESEGHVDPDMSILHIQIEQALRQKQIRQLLENARVRMEEEEFPLALHKVSDVLLMEPGNLDAKALKEEIEKRRDSTQLSHWFRLVREHLDANLFGQAREDLQEILKIDSSNTEAREMLAQIDQTEQEMVKSREEKQRLYENAVAAYRNGEANTALTHLERALAIARRSARSSSPDLDAQCQSFYDSIRGERDTAFNAYQQGRNLLSERRIDEALALCEQYLIKHPDDARFLALKLEAEEAKRDQYSATISEVSRQVDAEADLDQKHKILQEAVTAHPDETHFRSALKLISDRRDLVNSIVARARQYEERNQFSDALGQLDVLRNVHPSFPGLEAEMQRLTGRRDEQLQLEAKARWIEQVDAHVSAAEYDKALAVLPEALAAFPGDADLLQRQVTAQEGLAHNSEASALLKEGLDLCSSHHYQDGLTALRKAERLDPRNRSARAALLSGLVAYARELMPTDWHAAEPLVKEALDLEPTDPVARSLLSVLDDNRRQAAINIILAGARNYQTDGHLADALQIVERGLVQYPNDHRLIQFFNSLRTQAGQPMAPAARSKMAPAPPMPVPEPVTESEDGAAAMAANVAEAATPAEPETVAAAIPPALLVNEQPKAPQQALFAPPTTELPIKESAAPKPDKEPAKPLARGDSAKAPGPSEARVLRKPPKRREMTPGSLMLRPMEPPRRDPGVLEELSFKGPVWVVAALVALALILSAGVYQLLHKPDPNVRHSGDSFPDARRSKRVNSESAMAAPATALYPIALDANVPGTQFTEGGQTLAADAQLSAGTHTIEAFHEGYIPDSKIITVEAGAAAPVAVKFELHPMLPQLRLSSLIAHGKMVIDDGQPLELQIGVASKEDLAIGPHTVKVYDGNLQVFSFAFEAKPNEIPTLTTPLGNQPVQGTIVTSLAGSAKVYGTAGLRAAMAADAALNPLPPAGLAVAGSSANPGHFFLDSGKAGHPPQELSVNPSTFPNVAIQLLGASDPYSLVISTNATGCEVSIDGQTVVRSGKGPVPAPPTIDPGTHAVRLSCAGYQDLEKSIVVKPGEAGPHKVDFVLARSSVPASAPSPALGSPVVAPPTPASAPPARRAVLSLTGAPPETPVFQNQIRIGTVGPDGTFSRELDPGNFTFEWRHPGYETRKESRTVKMGDTIRLDGAMVPLTGNLVLKVSPPNVRILLHRDSDNTSFNAPLATPIQLAPGAYRVTAQAPDYRERSETVTVASGKLVTLAWDLEKIPVVKGPLRYFENGDWKPAADADGFWESSGSGYATLRTSTGAIGIDFLKKKHPHKINILADCPDHANCIVYALDGHNLTVKVTSGGHTVLDEKKAHGMDGDASYHLLFEMTPDAIVVKNQAGTVLSSVERTNPRGKLAIQDGNPLKIN